MDWIPVTDWLLGHGIRILIIIALSIVVYVLMKKSVPRTIRIMLTRTMERQPKKEVEKRKTTLTRLIITVGAVIIIVISAILILGEVGINITALLAGLSVAGIAIGFGAQYLIRDLIAGFFIIVENQYNVRDVIQVAGVEGMVEAVNLRRTLLRDLDGILHVVPNGEIKVASNLTKLGSRANLNISVAYKEDLDRVMSIIRKTWEEMADDPEWGEFLIAKTPWLLRVDEFRASGVVIKVVGETRPIRQWDVMGELRRRIKKVFDEQGIQIL